MRDVIDFGQFGVTAISPDGHSEIPVDTARFCSYHTHINGRGQGLICVGRPDYDNNILVEKVIDSLYDQLVESKEETPEGIPHKKGAFSKKVVEFLVNNTVNPTLGMGYRDGPGDEDYELRLIEAALAIQRYFGARIIQDPGRSRPKVAEIRGTITDKVTRWLA